MNNNEAKKKKKKDNNRGVFCHSQHRPTTHPVCSSDERKRREHCIQRCSLLDED